MYKQPTLTKSWNYDIFVQISHSYFQLFISDTLLGSFLDVLFLLLTVILSETHGKALVPPHRLLLLSLRPCIFVAIVEKESGVFYNPLQAT